MINMLLNLLGFVLLLMTSVVLGILVWNTRINQPSQVTVRIKDNNYEIRPIWSFKKSQDSSSSSDTEVIFDGITGKELIQ